MPAFRYMAIAPDGEVARGTIDAPSEAEAVARLRVEGRIPMRVDAASVGWSLNDLLRREFRRGKALTRQEVANVTRELAIMLAAGLDLDRALRFLAETGPNARVRSVMNRLRDAVRDGSSLAAALADHPRSFTQLYVGMVRAGEAGGHLAETLERLAGLLERQRSLSANIHSAMIYPTILVLAAIGSISLLLTKVLPQFASMFEQSGVALPGPTRMLMGLGDFAGNEGPYLLLAVLVLSLAVRELLRLPAPRLFVDRLLLHLPVIRSLSREVLAARFSRALGTLLVNGVPLIAALDIVKGTLGNRAGVVAVDQASQSARNGAGLSGPLAEAGVLPTRTIYLLRLGEETAQLGPMALRAAEIHDEQARIAIQRLVALLVPAITIVMGAVIAAIVSSLLLAMISVNDLAS